MSSGSCGWSGGRLAGTHTPVAQHNLGLMYENGNLGVPQDYAEAVRLFRLAADQGLVRAQCCLAFMYADGTKVPQDFTEAVRWCRVAACQGEAQAQCNLGVMYKNGTGVPQDHTEAARWYQGNAQARCTLALMYCDGTGVSQDYTAAARFFKLAADQGPVLPLRAGQGRPR